MPLYNPAAAGAAGALTKITETMLVADAANFDFTAIPGTYAHLRLVVIARCTGAGNVQLLKAVFNNDTGANYAHALRRFYSSATDVVDNLTGCMFGHIPSGSAGANKIATLTIDIPRYASTTFFKVATVVSASWTDAAMNAVGGVQWYDASAINRITLTPGDGDFLAGSSATLYGLS